MRTTTRWLRDNNGFTLIELLIVIVVLGILAGIAVFTVGSSKKDATSTACKTDFKTIALSAEAVNTKTGSYPATAAELLKTAIPFKGGVLDEYPTSSEYKLVYAGSGTSFTITVQNSGGTPVGSPSTSVSACDSL